MLTRLCSPSYIDSKFIFGTMLNISRVGALFKTNRCLPLLRNMSENAPQEGLNDKVELSPEENELMEYELEVDRKRNKSSMKPQHYNMHHGEMPYTEAQHSIHYTVKYQRKLFGKFGFASGVDPSLCWMHREEFEDKKEYDTVAQPYTVLEMIKMHKEKKLEEQKRIREREEMIESKMAKMDQWIQDMNNRNKKKMDDANAIKLKKEKLMEEVRRHFGFKIDTKDTRFQKVLEEREKEQKKAEKAAKKAAKAEQMLLKIQQKNAEISSN